MGIETKGGRDADLFEVAGKRADGTSAVKHVGLLASSMHVTFGEKATLIDMGPPFHFKPPAQVRVDVLGWLPLSEEEKEDLNVWLSDLYARKVTIDYRAIPAEESRSDPDSDLIVHYCFSCAGFVCCAYRVATDLTLVDMGALPSSDRALVDQIWGDGVLGGSERLTQWYREQLEQSGLTGSGPWPVLLPGHVLRALQEPRSALPYKPIPSDATFPY